MDLQRQMKQYKDELLKTAFGDLSDEEKKSYSAVFVELCRDIRKSNERYNDRRITIYNLYRQESEIINSLIIGLAHHVDFCRHGETDNTQGFRDIYQDILFKALDADKLSYDELKNSNDYQTKKPIRNILASYWRDESKTESERIIEVRNCYDIRDVLKNSGFVYNELLQSWEKRFPFGEIRKVSANLAALKPDVAITTRSVNRMVFEFTAYVCITGKTYDYRDILKDNGYRFRDNKWHKKILNSQFLTEREKILDALPKGQGIKVEMTY
ncbi:MAG: hypothetical protein E7383_07630 [Ruminococcaceae bacterium]|nr:hypothetical protein [Oscillospiraceae bacterium]